MTKLTRKRDRRVIAGVCAAVAEGLGLSTGLVRAAFVLFGLFGIGEVVYIVLWVLLPNEA
jgi:phage shock protein C